MIRIITALALRLFALYLVTMVAMDLPMAIALLVPGALPGVVPVAGVGSLSMVAAAGVAIVAAIVLWKLGGGALRAAEALDVQRAGAGLADDTMGARQWQRTLFMLLGTYFCVRAGVDLAGLLLRWRMLPDGAVASFSLYLMLQPLLQLLIGIALVLGRDGSRRLLGRVRER